MTIRILTAASRDLIRGKRFYESQENGLGEYFFDSLSSDIDSLIVYAGIHREISNYYCMLSKRFPYAVYYKIECEQVRGYRVLDCSQQPIKTAKALAGGDGQDDISVS